MTNIFESAAEIRILVGYLAEQHASWFGSQFFGPRASAFLSPVFARTAFQAQCNGVTTAAARVHDEAIGVGRTHHLFRLPEVLEQGVAAALVETEFVEQMRQHVTAPDAALARLEILSAPDGAASEGAQVMAGEFIDGAEALLGAIAGVYLDAFRKGIKAFPFVREA
ncbi:BrxE family protein [Paraburkholderia youngii]|uniref:BrxE family protein n=1 Tax=Paraburkholderia youngii TaxID=2782701 RepID=UPI003D1E1618